MTKPLSYEALMMLPLDQLQALFPFGAQKVGKAKWCPAENEKDAERSLKRLLLDKKKRSENPMWLLRTPPAHRDRRSDVVKPPTTKEIRDAAEASAYTANPVDPMDAGERVPPNWQEQISAEAHERDEDYQMSRLLGEREALKRQLASYERLVQREGVDGQTHFRAVERRLQEIDRKLGIRKAA